MKLYYLPGACSLTDHIVLEWTGASYAAVEVQRDQLKSPEYLEISPGGLVPALLEDDGWALTENIAILHYLAEKYPEAKLAGEDARSRAEVNRWLGFLNSEVHQSFKPLFGPGRFIADEAQHAELQANAKHKLQGLFARIDAQLAEHAWLAGSQRSIADPYLFVMLRWAGNKQISLDGMQHIATFFQRMQADSGVQAAMHAEGL